MCSFNFLVVNDTNLGQRDVGPSPIPINIALALVYRFYCLRKKIILLLLPTSLASVIAQMNLIGWLPMIMSH